MSRARRAPWRATWWTAFTLLLCLLGAWSLSVPPMSGHDEVAHTGRAAGLLRGQVLGDPLEESNAFIWHDVPATFADVSYLCYYKRPDATPDCAPPLSQDRSLQREINYQFRSQPVYYLLPGLPTLALTGTGAVYAMRLASAAICAALLASAIVALRELGASAWMLAGLGIALTPEVLYLGGTVNSNGVEIAAAVAAWTSMLVLARSERPAHRAVHRAGVALAVLTATRGLSPGFAALVVIGALLVARPGRPAALWQRSDVRRWLGVIGVVAVLSAAYVLYVQSAYPLERPGQGVAHAISLVPWYLEQAVGVFGWNDLPLPAVVHIVWAAALLGIVGAALSGDRRGALVVIALLVLSILLQVTAEGLALPPIGFLWQGRYILPLLVGVPLVAGALAADPPPGRAGRRWPPLVVLGAVAGGQLLSLAWLLRRYSVGASGPLHPAQILGEARWSPPGGPVALLGVAVVATGGLMWASVRLSRRPAPSPPG